MKDADIFKYAEEQLTYLMLNENFQKSIELFRKKWNLPLCGFKNDSEKKKWDQHLNQLEKKERDALLKLSHGEQQHGVFKLPKNQYNQELKNLIETYKLDSDLKDNIKAYILFNDFNYSSSQNTRIKFFNNSNELISTKERFLIEIFPDTTIKDIQKEWSNNIKKQLPKKNIRNKLSPEFKRDLMMYQLHRKGKTFEEIRSLIKEDYPKLYTEEIKKRIYDFKCRINEILS